MVTSHLVPALLQAVKVDWESALVPGCEVSSLWAFCCAYFTNSPGGGGGGGLSN